MRSLKRKIKRDEDLTGLAWDLARRLAGADRSRLEHAIAADDAAAIARELDLTEAEVIRAVEFLRARGNEYSQYPDFPRLVRRYHT